MKIQCLVCDEKNNVEPQKRGSTAIEVILWLCYLIPGLIYHLWRNEKKEYVCPSCNSTSIKIIGGIKKEKNIHSKELQKTFVLKKEANYKKIKELENTSVAESPLEDFKKAKKVLNTWIAFTVISLLMNAAIGFIPFFVLLVITLLGYNFQYLPVKNKTPKNDQKKAIKKTPTVVWVLSGLFFVVLPVIFISYSLIQDAYTFEFEIKNGNYTKISNNLVETKTKEFDLNLHTNAVKKLLINDKNVEISDSISYPIKIEDDSQFKISITKKNGETLDWDLKVDFLTEVDLLVKKEKEKLLSKIRAEEALKKEEINKQKARELAEKNREEVKKDLTDTIETYNEGFTLWDNWKLVEIINKGLNSNDQEIKNLANKLKTTARNFQARDYPKKRTVYAKELRDTLWEEDFEVRISGSSKDVLTLINYNFASNGRIQLFQERINSKVHDLRFSQIRYKWVDSSYAKSSSYTLKTDLDTKIEGLD